MVPALLIAAWFARHSAESERAQIETHAQETVRKITTELDRKLASAKDIVTVLGMSHHLGIGDIEHFRTKAKDVSRRLNVQVVLSDIQTGAVLINSATSDGSAPATAVAWPPERLRAEEAALHSGAVTISDAFVSPLAGRLVICVVLPIVIDGAARYALSLAIPTDSLRTILLDQRLEYGAVVSVVDSNNIVIARSVLHETWVGKAVPANLLVSAPDREGSHVGLSMEGLPFYWAHVRPLEKNGWVVGVGLPLAVLKEPFHRIFRNLIIAGGFVLGIAILAAGTLADRILKTAGVLGIDRQPTREEFELLFQSAPNGVLVVDGRGCIVLLNARIEKQFGYAAAELVGKSIELLIPERHRSRHVALRAAYVSGPHSGPMGAGRDLFGRRKDGSEFPIEVQLNPINAKGGTFVSAAVMDISERRRSADALTSALNERDEMRRRFLQAQEDERLRLAHELHDQSGQSLAAAMVELKVVEDSIDETSRERLRRLRTRLDHLGRTLRHVAWELRPPSIDELGLSSAIMTYAADWSTQFGIDCDVHCSDDRIDELPDDIRTTIYRVTQEALTNVAKHAASATSVSVIIERAGNVLRLTIEDDGCGFDEDARAVAGPDRRGLGLAGMRERLLLIGGTFQVESAPDSGTTIFVRIPLERQRIPA